MKKAYIIPFIRLHAVHPSNIIVTSDNIPIGGDQGDVTTDAPRRNDDWADYNR